MSISFMFIFFLQVSVSLLLDVQATGCSRSCCPLGTGRNYRALHIPSALIYNQAKKKSLRKKSASGLGQYLLDKLQSSGVYQLT